MHKNFLGNRCRLCAYSGWDQAQNIPTKSRTNKNARKETLNFPCRNQVRTLCPQRMPLSTNIAMCQLGSFVQKPNARKPYVVGGSLHKTARNAPEPFLNSRSQSLTQQWSTWDVYKYSRSIAILFNLQSLFWLGGPLKGYTANPNLNRQLLVVWEIEKDWNSNSNCVQST